MDRVAVDTKDLETLSGIIERVTFHSEESGFFVIRLKVRGHRELLGVVGVAATLHPGEYAECQGFWQNDKNHGLQFKAVNIKIVPPSTLYGIEKYLGSGMVKGMGPFYAKKLVKAFGEAVFDVIEKDPNQLSTIDGIGKKRKEKISQAWAEQKYIREIMVFLHAHGVGTMRAVKIFKVYGNNAIEVIRKNPYQLSLDIHGIGFKTADTIAQKIGIARDSMLRARAGVRHVLQEVCDRGHCACLYEKLVQSSCKMLEIQESIIIEAINKEVGCENLVRDEIDTKDCVFLGSLYQTEISIAKHLQRLLTKHLPWGQIDVSKALPWLEKKTVFQLSDSQKKAIVHALEHKISIITGGPGVGKTTIVKCILDIVKTRKLSIGLCSPTGKAAKRLSEMSGMEAKTIHRLLEFDSKHYAFRYNHETPLPYDFIIIDEVSMIDVYLLNAFLKAVPEKTAVLFVGDVDQLPSVGPGAILADMINSKKIPTTRLTEIFRQAATSKIIINAHRINQGQLLLPNEQTMSDFYVIYNDDAELIREKLIQMACERIPNYFKCDPVKDIQILTPMNKGGMGARSLNLTLQQKFQQKTGQQNKESVTRYGIQYFSGDKVIQTVNNYDKEIYNGDVGIVHGIDLDKSEITVQFDKRFLVYEFSELDELSLAYALTIHKSQGSEYPIVIIPIVIQHYALLAKNLLYTAVTRGEKLVVLIGQKRAVAMAIKNDKDSARLTKLKQGLIELL